MVHGTPMCLSTYVLPRLKSQRNHEAALNFSLSAIFNVQVGYLNIVLQIFRYRDKRQDVHMYVLQIFITIDWIEIFVAAIIMFFVKVTQITEYGRYNVISTLFDDVLALLEDKNNIELAV